MAKLTLEEAKDFSVLPDETLIRIRVETVKPKDVPPRDGREGWTKLEFTCEIIELPYAMAQEEGYSDLIGTKIWASTGMKFTMHPDNKLRQWAEALLNMGELDAGFELDTDLLEGRTARAVVGHYDRKDGQRRNQIDGLLPDGQLGGGASSLDQQIFGNTNAAPSQNPTAVQQQPATVGASDPWSSGAADDDPPF